MQRVLVVAVVLLVACSPASRDEQPSSAPAQPPARVFDNRPSPPLPAELRDGALKRATPDEIRDAIRRYGGEAVVRSLYGERSDEGRNRVAEGIASGDQVWLDLVPLLREGGQRTAAPSEILTIVVSDALPRNASGVLRLIDDHEPVRVVCDFRRVEPTDAEIEAFYAAAIPAVEAVREPELQDLKRQCLAALTINQAEVRAADTRSEP